MKSKKKRVGTKAQIRALKERERRIATTIFLAFILLIIIFSAYFSYSFLNTFPSQSQNQINNLTSELKAAIVDQASLSPAGGFNETFIEKAINILKKAGYSVDYYPSEQVTVEFYRNLPTYSYELIILRVHSTATRAQGTEAPVTLFTSERLVKTKYVYEQTTEQLYWVVYSTEEQERGIEYFGIAPNFVKQSMKGRFQNTAIIMTGCEGLENSLMASAFVEKGAKVYIGWDKAIFFSHTDVATINLLQHLLTEKQTINQAVRNTMKEVGPDPADNSILSYYPLEAGEQTIENNTGKS